jgi:hypothetical protein
VDKQSAIQPDPNSRDCFPINEDHSDMVKFSDGSPEYHVVIGFMHSLLPSVPPNSHAALEDEPLKAIGNQSSSQSGKLKADDVHNNRTGGVDADSSRVSTNATISCPEANLF